MTAASPVAQALALAAARRPADAVARLEAAGADGDVDALMQLAVWALAGDPVPRDLRRARALLRRTVAIGHVDAALMEVALTANGSGAPADWPGAVALLEIAARGDPVAAGQLRLLRAMTLDATGAPVAPPRGQPLSARPDVTLFHALFTADECLHVAQAAAPLLEPAQVIDPATGRAVPHPVRTSDGAAIGPAREDLVIRALNRRIATASGTDVAQGEPLTVLRYAPGQQYRPHHDAFADAANQRGWTMLVYLNQGYRGGETRFTATGLTVAGRLGDGLLFRNLLADGRPDPAARHAGLPVAAGHKWLATRWIRERAYDPWTEG